MFSANENLLLRQHKRRVVSFVEATIPDSVLDLGVNVMVMQVACKAPGCVPIETAIIIVFPPSETPLLPGLPESQGGSYKTKILKPMDQIVTQDDVLEALPPAFKGGKRSIQKLCIQARDVMLGQITQLFGQDDEDVQGRRLLAEYLQHSLQQYMDRNCVPPEWGEEFDDDNNNDKEDNNTAKASQAILTGTENIVIKRPSDKEETTPITTPRPPPTSNLSNVNTVTSRRQQQAADRYLSMQSDEKQHASTLLTRLSEREHSAPGIRRASCPCCDPDNPCNYATQMMQL